MKRELAKILRDEAKTWVGTGPGQLIHEFAEGVAQRLEDSADFAGEPPLKPWLDPDEKER